MNNRNLLLLLSAGAVVIVLAVLVPVFQNRQEFRQHAAGFPAQVVLPTQAWRNPHYNGNAANPPITITLPPEQDRYQSPNDTIPPIVTITSPQNGSQIQSNSTVTLTATASDNVGVSKVEFLVNGSVVCITTRVPYTCIWQVPSQPNMQYVIIARAYDLTGNLSSKSVVVQAK